MKNKTYLGFLFVFLVLGIMAGGERTQAATINAASCEQADVQAKLNQAVAGDTVVLPAGTCHWTTNTTWTSPANVTLKGAGTDETGGGDRTVIIDDYTTNKPLFEVSLANTGTFRMTGITLQGGTGVVKYGGVLHFNGPGNVRLDHLHLNTNTYSPVHYNHIVWIGDRVYGVLDHSILDLYSVSAIYIYNFGPDGQGNSAWAEDTNFGSGNFFFIEDNVINGTPSTHDTRVYDCMVAGRIVVRYNTLVSTCAGEDHATGSSADVRGCRAHEIYGNFSLAGSGQEVPNYDLIDIGSGVAMVWGNQAESVYKHVMHFNVTRKNNATYTQLPTPDRWGYCGTEFNGTGSNWDQNSDLVSGYACIDQPGRGKGDFITGSFPNKVNSVTGTISWPRQALEPIYFWANKASVMSGWGGSWYASDTGGRVASDRDYYMQASGVQTSPTSPFNGTTGTGWGTLANRPNTCTTGVGYFAIDQGSWNKSNSNPYGVQQNGANGVLYKCTATNTWTQYYTPYTYPHPLTVTDNPTDITAPVAPTGLNVR